MKNNRIIALLLLAVSGQALAADNLTVKDGTGATKTLGKKDIAGVLYDRSITVLSADGTTDASQAIINAQQETNANAGSDATKAVAVQGVTGGKAVPVSDNGGSITIDGSLTNISGTITLPTGAATSAKQPALGTAGTASSDVITVQGIASGTNLNVNCAAGCAGGTQYAEDAVAASGNSLTGAGVVQTATPADAAADGDWAWLQMKSGRLWAEIGGAGSIFGTATDASIQSGACTTALACWRSIRDDLRTLATDTSVPTVVGFAGTATTTITRPADAALYAANDAFANSTSSPTSGGFTLTGMCRTSGGSGLLTDLVFVYSTATSVTGELWIYDSSVTAQNDNAAWSVTDGDQLKLVAKIPFSTVADTLNAVYTANGLSIGYTCSGSSDLRYMVKITTSYTPASGDTLTVRAKFQQTN